MHGPILLLLLLWHAPPGVSSVSERTILSHVDCFIQGEVTGFQVLLDSLRPRIVGGCPGGLLQFSKGAAVKTYCDLLWHLFRPAFAQCG